MEYELDSDILKSVLAIAESTFQKHAEMESCVLWLEQVMGGGPRTANGGRAG
ncbi:MAG: hypothetical protein ABIK28_05710 [Planctomycetota bacterium]